MYRAGHQPHSQRKTKRRKEKRKKESPSIDFKIHSQNVRTSFFENTLNNQGRAAMKVHNFRTQFLLETTDF